MDLRPSHMVRISIQLLAQKFYVGTSKTIDLGMDIYSSVEEHLPMVSSPAAHTNVFGFLAFLKI